MSDQEPTVYNGRYELHRQIARGGMADVFLARDLLLDRPVAVKVLFPQFATDPAFVERFRREAQAAANLNQPNITSVFDWGQEGDTYFIVMEFVDGRSLAEILKTEGMLHPDRAADIAIDVAAALSFAHRNGVVHRDIKPGNILIAPTGQVKVTDFGIARAFGGAGAETNLTQTGSVMGTATYFSPEQAQGQPVDPRSDLYSLGVVLYEMLASQPPFTADSALGIAYMHVQEDASPPSSVNPRIPSAMDAITMKLLAKDPNDRYPSAEDLRADLRRFREGQPVLAAGGAALATAAMIAQPDATAAIPVTPPPFIPPSDEVYDDYDDAPNRTGWFIAGLVLLVAVLIALLAVFANALGIGGGTSADRIEVPGVLERTEEEARQILTDEGFEVAVEYEANVDVEPGIVFRQDPSGGSLEPEGATITIFVSAGDAQFPMDQIVGFFEDEAVAFLEAKGLVLGTVNRVFDDQSVDGEVLTQFPEPGTLVGPGTLFDITVSQGPELVEVPDVRGEELDEAIRILEEAGFQTQVEDEHSATVDEERVIVTEPAHRTEAPKNSFVVIVVSIGPEPAEEVAVPNVVNLTQISAEQSLTAAGFLPQVTFSPSNSVPSGSVVTQSPAGGTLLLQGSAVAIVVSTGPSGSTTSTTGGGGSTSTSTSTSLGG